MGRKKKKSHILASDAALVAEFLVRSARTKKLDYGKQSYVNDYVYSILLNRFGFVDEALPKRDFLKHADGYCYVGSDRVKELLPVPFNDQRDFVFSIYASKIFDAIEKEFDGVLCDELLNGFILSGFAVEAGYEATDSDSSNVDAVANTALEWLDLFDELDGVDLLIKAVEYIPDYVWGLHEVAWIDADYLSVLMEDDYYDGDESSVVIPDPANLHWLVGCVEDVIYYAKAIICFRYGLTLPGACMEETNDVVLFFERMKKLILQSIHIDGMDENEARQIGELSYEVWVDCFYEMVDECLGIDRNDSRGVMFVCHISSDLMLYKKTVRSDCGYPYLGQMQRLYNLLQNPSVSVYLEGEWKDMGEESNCKSFTTKSAEVFLYKCYRSGGGFLGTMQFPWFRLERTVFRILLDDYLNYIEYARHTSTEKEEVRDA